MALQFRNLRAEWSTLTLRHNPLAAPDAPLFPFARPGPISRERRSRNTMKFEYDKFEFHGKEPSMRIAMHDLKLDALYVVYPGAHRFRLAPSVEAVPLWALLPPR